WRVGDGRGNRRRNPKILKKKISVQGYEIACPSKDGRVFELKVHRLVAKAFLGDSPPNKTHVLHKDDIKTNNHVSNLYWGDDADNMRDMIKNGRLLRGSDKTDAKLSEEDIENIRAKYAEGNVPQHQ